MSLMLGDHPPSRHCDCPDCRNYFFGWPSPFSRTPMLDRMRAENRPHLRDHAFLKFMAKIVGNTLNPK